MRTSCPSVTAPAQSVPVTTVPMPRSVKQRSTCMRVGPSREGRGARDAVTRSSASHSWSRPVPSVALTATSGVSA